ncbi:MAG TPA: ATP-binding protein [Gemmataceae bacterium]
MAASVEALWQRLFELAPVALLVVNRAGRITLVNREAERMFGRGRDELVGHPLGAFAPQRYCETCARLISPGAPDGGSPECPTELAWLGRDGRELPAQITRSTIEAGEESLVVLAVRGVSDPRRDGEEARARQQAAVSELGRRALAGIELSRLMGEAVALVRSSLGVEFAHVLELLPDGKVVFRAGAGWPEELAGRVADEPLGPVPAADVLLGRTPAIVEDIRGDERFPDGSLLRKHGVVSSANVPLYGHDRPFGVLGAHSTRRRRFTPADVSFLQSVANVLSAALERKWYEERQRERHLQRAEQMMALGQVAAGVAHELRNPLTSVKGLVQVNLREARAAGVPAEDLEVIEHEIRRMERTLQVFLDFARPPQPDRRPLSLADVAERVLALVKGRAKKQQVELKLSQPDAPVLAEADRDQLQQLLLNLVLNALDAMPGGGTLEVEVRPPRDGSAEVTVRDTGPGIAPHILPKVFETFVSGKETGVGLGLPVSRRIAEEHGGSLSVYNLPGGGACLVLRLPALEPAGPGDGPDPAAPRT